jgi:hypothetical protein
MVPKEVVLPDKIKVDEKPEPSWQAEASDRWAIKLTLNASAAHYGVGLAFALGELKNMKTGNVRQGRLVGGGIGLGLMTPSSNPFQDWVEFKTGASYLMDAFEGTPAKLYGASIGLLFGGSYTILHFYQLDAEKIQVGGFQMGGLGIDISDNMFMYWEFTD